MRSRATAAQAVKVVATTVAKLTLPGLDRTTGSYTLPVLILKAV